MTQFKVGDYVERAGFANFWPGRILSVGADEWSHRVLIYWLHQEQAEWHNSRGLKKVPPLKLLAYQAEE